MEGRATWLASTSEYLRLILGSFGPCPKAARAPLCCNDHADRLRDPQTVRQSPCVRVEAMGSGDGTVGCALMTDLLTRSRTGSQQAGIWGLRAVIMAMVTAMFVVLSLSSVLDVRTAVVWAGLALAAFAMVMQCLLAAQSETGLGLARWRFGPWTLLWVAFAFGLATMSWYWPAEGSATRISVSYVLSAVWLIMAATSTWTVGYLVGPPAFVRRPARRALTSISHRRLPTIRSLFTPWLLFGIGMLARILTALTTGSFGYVGDAGSGILALSGYKQLLVLLGLFSPLAVAAVAIQVFIEKRKEARFSLAILFIFEILIGALGGGKQSFVVAVLALLIPFSASRLRMPRLAVVSAGLIFLLLIIPFNQAYRTTVRSDSFNLSITQAFAAAPDVLNESLRIAFTPTALPDAAAYFFTRVRIIDGPALILQRSPDQIPFRGLDEVLLAPAIGLVPRAVWPSKPVLDTSYQFAQTYYGPSAAFSSSAITPQGDLYRHGGWLVMLFGMCLLGVLTRLLDVVFNVTENTHGIFYVLLLFPDFIKMEIDMVSLLASLPATLLAATAAVYLSFGRRTRV